MKKKKYILLIMLLFVIILVLFDLFIPRGKKITNLDYKDYDKLLNTYSIKETNEMIELTLYNTSPLTSKIIYKFQDENIVDILYEREYLNKSEALWYYLTDNYKEKYNANLKGNIIEYSSSKDSIKDNTKSDIQNLIKQIRQNPENNIILGY